MKLVKKSNLMNQNLWIALSISILSTVTQAATSSTTTTTATTATPAASTAPAAVSTAAAPKKEEPPKASFGFIYEAGYSMQAETQADGTRSQSLSHGFTPTMRYGEYSAKLVIGYEQDLNDSKSNGFADPSIAVAKKPWKLGNYFSLGPSGSLVIPTTDESKNNVGLMYNIGGALTLNLNTKTLGWDSLTLGYQLAFNKNFTDYDTNAKTGLPNNSHKIRNRLMIGYQITDAFSFFNMFDFNSSYSVNGVVTNSFLTLQSFGYSVTDNVAVSLSHTLGGPYLKAGTYENNLKFYDSKESQLGLGLEVTL